MWNALVTVAAAAQIAAGGWVGRQLYDRRLNDRISDGMERWMRGTAWVLGAFPVVLSTANALGMCLTGAAFLYQRLRDDFYSRERGHRDQSWMAGFCRSVVQTVLHRGSHLVMVFGVGTAAGALLPWLPVLGGPLHVVVQLGCTLLSWHIYAVWMLDLTILDVLVQASPVLEVPRERAERYSRFSLLETLSKMLAPLLVLVLGLLLPDWIPRPLRMFVFGASAGMQMHVTACDARGMSQSGMVRRWEIEGLAYSLIGWAIELLSDALFVPFTADERPAMIVSTMIGITVAAAATCQPRDYGDVKVVRIACHERLDATRERFSAAHGRRGRLLFADLWLGLPFAVADGICAAVCTPTGPRRVLGTLLFGVLATTSAAVVGPDLCTLLVLGFSVLGFVVGPTLLPQRPVAPVRLALRLLRAYVFLCDTVTGHWLGDVLLPTAVTRPEDDVHTRQLMGDPGATLRYVTETLAWVKRAQDSRVAKTAADGVNTAVLWLPGFELFLRQFGLPPFLVRQVSALLRMNDGELNDLTELRLHFAARLVAYTQAAIPAGGVADPIDWEPLGIDANEVTAVNKRASAMSVRPAAIRSIFPGAARVSSGQQAADLSAELKLAVRGVERKRAWREGFEGTAAEVAEVDAAVEAAIAAVEALERDLREIEAPAGGSDDEEHAGSSFFIVADMGRGGDAAATEAALTSRRGPNGCGIASCPNGMYFGFRHTCRMCHREVCSECTRYATVNDIYMHQHKVNPQQPAIGLGYLSGLVGGMHPVCLRCDAVRAPTGKDKTA
mmetsp:Transcript_29453/g.77188  ORF Transcript_29453/g.77188 Transcript_29453/m.77188 type:complete len:784 (+) Transcript_29453:260-2611(+)